jgi:amino acid adenylation domain-containing protein
MLGEIVSRQRAVRPEALAVKGFDGALTYAELDDQANQIARALVAGGVAPGDRVGVWMEKGVRAVVAMQGALRANAAYVPIDPLAPELRARALLEHAGVRAVVTSTEARATVARALAAENRPIHVIDDRGWQAASALDARAVERAPRGARDLAYILYTSGSTGTPKGVCIGHGAALAFIDWARQELGVSPADRLAGHAPLHFDLSVFDLYAAFASGASVTLLPESTSFSPHKLVEQLAHEALTVWYSVPSALMLMIDRGGLLEADLPHLRAIVFAGEPFPIGHLRRVRERMPQVRLLNFYGPTETNVCTFHEVHAIDPSRVVPVPIGRACAGDAAQVRTADGRDAASGEAGELFITGPTVMLGYWGEPPRDPEAPYATGDVVRVEEDGALAFVGRRDDMVKVRGHRMALGEIEAVLQAHDAIREAAVVVACPGTLEAALVAFVVRDPAKDAPATLLELKVHCAARLPRSMVVDRVRYLEALPRTGNGKIDRADLNRRLV